MNEINKLFKDVKSGWDNLDKKKKSVLVIIVIALLLAIILFTISNNNVTYVTLFNELEAEDAGVIVNDLENKKIKYSLEDQGRKILIDEKHIDEYRLQLAMEGNMPEDTSGFEMFDDVGLMATDEDRKIMYQRALTGELQRSIMSLDAVNNAKVHLVLSKKSIFETHANEASASVILDLNPEYKITTDMIRGIAALLTGAVENLPDENIRIIDSKGKVLSNVLREDRENSTASVNEYQALREDFEYNIESNLMELLGGIFGWDKIKVMVYAELDFDSEERSIIRYENPVIRSEQIEVTGNNLNSNTDLDTDADTDIGNNNDTQDVTGGNIEDNVSNVIEGLDGNATSYSKTTNNELTTENIKTIKAPGKLNRLTTSVVYDGEISEERNQQIHNIVASAIGYDYERGDSISIEGIVFDRTYEDGFGDGIGGPIVDGQDKGFLHNFYNEYKEIINIGLIILGITIVVLFIKVISKRREEEKEEVFHEVEEEYAASKSESSILDNIDFEKLESQASENANKAQEYAKKHPEIVADLIKAWMKDEG